MWSSAKDFLTLYTTTRKPYSSYEAADRKQNAVDGINRT